MFVLHHKGVDLPGDYDGVVYVPYDEAGYWKVELAKAMRINVNLVT